MSLTVVYVLLEEWQCSSTVDIYVCGLQQVTKYICLVPNCIVFFHNYGSVDFVVVFVRLIWSYEAGRFRSFSMDCLNATLFINSTQRLTVLLLSQWHVSWDWHCDTDTTDTVTQTPLILTQTPLTLWYRHHWNCDTDTTDTDTSDTVTQTLWHRYCHHHL